MRPLTVFCCFCIGGRGSWSGWLKHVFGFKLGTHRFLSFPGGGMVTSFSGHRDRLKKNAIRGRRRSASQPIP